MYCPNCGKGGQEPDAYCRQCGQFLPDLTSNVPYLIKKLLGEGKPQTQITVNLVINLVTALISILLLGFLHGYFDAHEAKTGEGAPRVIYLVYLFLGVVAGWQLLSFVIGLRLKTKFSGNKLGAMTTNDTASIHAPLQETGNSSLPPADFDEIVPPRVTEDTTRMLDKLPRK